MIAASLLALLLPAVRCLAEWGYLETRDVVVLTARNFDQFVRDFPVSVIQYGSDHCDRCKDIEKDYSATAVFFKDAEVKVPLAKVDCVADAGLCPDLMIPSYPFVKVHVGSKTVDHQGDIDGRSLKHTIQTVLDKSPTLLASLAGIKAAAGRRSDNQKGIVAVYYGNPSTVGFMSFDAVCMTTAHITCRFVLDGRLASKLRLAEVGSVRLVQTGRRSATVSTKDMTSDELADRIYRFTHPRVRRIDDDFISGVVRRGKNFLVLFCDAETDGIVADFEKAVRRLRRHVECCVVSKPSTESGAGLRLATTLQVERWPSVVFVQPIHEMTVKRFVFRHRLTRRRLTRFLRLVRDNRIDPDLRSEAVPPAETGIVKVV